MDLTPYIAAGFSDDFDAMIANTPVRGIDRDQVQRAVRLCPETEHHLYEGGYSPTRVRYRAGARPVLEAIVADWRSTSPRASVLAAVAWVNRHVTHPHHTGPLRFDRAMTEEAIIESGIGWCNEQARVLIALCEVMDIPARLCFLFHESGRCSHAAGEAFVEGRWAFVDATFNVSVPLPDGRLAEGRELSCAHRESAHRAYAPALRRYYEAMAMEPEEASGWNRVFRPHPDRGGDLLHVLGISNYVTAGVEGA